MRCVLVLALLASSAASAATPKGRGDALSLPGSDAQRALKKRHITFTDENADAIPDLHVAPGVPTTLVFPQKVTRAQLADPKKYMYEATLNADTVILAAKRDVPANSSVPLAVTLADGSIFSFQAKTIGAEVDLQVDVEIAVQKNAAADSPQALRTVNAQLRGQLDECKASTNSAGVAQIATHILEQDLGDASAQPQVLTFDGHAIHSLDRQQRLLVEATYLYRLFGLSYLVLTIENRDPTKPWVLERPELKLDGGGAASDIAVQGFNQDISGSLAPGEKEKLVIVFKTPTQASNQKLSVSLLEKGGGRHVTLAVSP